MRSPPNPRLQRTRLRAPLSRKTLDAKRKRARGFLRRGITFLLPAAMSVSCSYGKTQPVLVTGRNFPCTAAVGIGAGMKPTEVRELLGEPLETRMVGSEEKWRYFYRWRYGDEIALLGLIPVSEPHYYGGCDVTLEFRNGELESVVYSRENRGPDGNRIEGPIRRALAKKAGGV
jgi:outer membrane protein assembly factor BamE (lipoprotein component of BamABCDE complex)